MLAILQRLRPHFLPFPATKFLPLSQLRSSLLYQCKQTRLRRTIAPQTTPQYPHWIEQKTNHYRHPQESHLSIRQTTEVRLGSNTRSQSIYSQPFLQRNTPTAICRSNGRKTSLFTTYLQAYRISSNPSRRLRVGRRRPHLLQYSDCSVRRTPPVRSTWMPRDRSIIGPRRNTTRHAITLRSHI